MVTQCVITLSDATATGARTLGRTAELLALACHQIDGMEITAATKAFASRTTKGTIIAGATTAGMMIVGQPLIILVREATTPTMREATTSALEFRKSEASIPWLLRHHHSTTQPQCRHRLLPSKTTQPMLQGTFQPIRPASFRWSVGMY